MVVLPWFGFDHAVMEAAFEPVFAGTTGWRRIYVDLPGTGDSRPVEPRSDAVLDAVEKTVRSVAGTAPFLLAGCSYGGYLAAGLARRDPAGISGLLLVCPGIKIHPDQRNLSRLVPPSPQPGWLEEIPAELQEHLAHAVGNQTRAVAIRLARAVGLSGPTDWSYLEQLRSGGYELSDEASPVVVDANVTILAGTQDCIVGHLDQFDVLARYPHGSFVALGDAGHYLPFEQPEVFKVLTLSWLTRDQSALSPDRSPGLI